jgi:myo-inositol 2-dehydrogenase / D-chiro-inositol 1-dehydrogenase
VSFPAGKPFTFFMDRLAAAFRTELTAFTEVVADRSLHAIAVRAPPSPDRGGPGR